MTRSLVKLGLLALLTLTAWVAMYCYERQQGDPAKRAAIAKAAAAADAKELSDLAARLNAAPQRTAGLLVTDQSESAGPTTAPTTAPATNPATAPAAAPAAGTVRTTLLFQEYAADGSPLPIKRFTFEGRGARIGSMVLQFQGPSTNGREPLRGASLPLFLRLAGDKEATGTSHPIDDANRLPAAYRGPEVAVTDFQRQLWREFWRLAAEEAYRTRMGVRAAEGQLDLGPLEKGRLYLLTLHPDASLTLKSQTLTPEAAKMLEQDEQKVLPQTMLSQTMPSQTRPSTTPLP